MKAEDKAYVDQKFSELRDFLVSHETKDHVAFEKIFDAINGSASKLESGIERLELVLALVKSLHEGKPK